MVKYASVALLFFLVCVCAASLLSTAQVARAFTQSVCPATQNAPQGICENEQFVDTGYYGCSSSPTVGCCSYDNVAVYCYDGYPMLPANYMGTEQVRQAIAYNSHCDGHYCVSDTVSTE